MKLVNLFFESMHMQPGDQQRYVISEFSKRVEDSGLKLWKPGDPIQNRGKRFLVSVAEFSREDLELLDALSELSDRSQLDIFMLSKCKSQSDIELYVPDVGPVDQSPVVGIWEDGVLVAKASGWQAKQILTKEINAIRLANL